MEKGGEIKLNFKKKKLKFNYQERTKTKTACYGDFKRTRNKLQLSVHCIRIGSRAQFEINRVTRGQEEEKELSYE